MQHTERFTARADSYVGGRPGYPAALAEVLASRGLLTLPCADVGAGTGLFTRLLLGAGATVRAVEPNDAMRAELERDLQDHVRSGRLSVLPGSAEETGLEAAGVGLVSCAQSAHWFDAERARAEFRRALAPGGALLLVWNDWRGHADTRFTRAYSAVVRRFTSNPAENATRVPLDLVARYFAGAPFEHLEFQNPVTFTRERLHALATSVSYLPARGTPGQADMQAALDAAFDAHQEGGRVTMAYVTHAFLGAL